MAFTQNWVQATSSIDGDAMREDTSIIEAILDGEESAYTQLVQKYRSMVYSLAYRYTHNHQEADDLTQETFIKAYQKLKTFRGDASFKTWIMRIATNLSINLKKSGRISKDSGQEPQDFFAASSCSQEARLLQSERNRELYAAIARLPPKQKETLMLKTFEQMTCKQVAEVMQCSVGTVKANVFNAVKRLRSLLVEGER